MCFNIFPLVKPVMLSTIQIPLIILLVLLLRTPEQCPSVVSLLSESYNPHVRYGAAMALGICCAGTGNKVRSDVPKLATLPTFHCSWMS